MARFFLLLFLFLVSFGPTILSGFWAFVEKEDGDKERLSVAAMFFDYSLIFLFLCAYAFAVFLIIYIPYKFIHLIFDFARQRLSTQPISLWTLTISVGLASLFLPATLQMLYRIFIGFFVNGSQQVITRPALIFNDGVQCVYSKGDTIDFGRCLTPLFNTWVAAVSGVLSSAFADSGLMYFDLAGLGLFLALVSIIYLAINQYLPSTSAGVRMWLAFGALSVFAIYLALSAILAVPLMQSKRNITEISPENLRTRLESFYTGGDKAKVNSGSSEAFSSAAVAADNSAKVDEKRPPDIRVVYLNTVLSDLASERDQVRGKLNELLSGFGEFKEGLIKNAVAVYETESAVRIGEREKSEHYLSILSWYRSRVESQTSVIQRCREKQNDIEVSYRKMSVQLKKLETLPPDTDSNTKDQLMNEILSNRQESLSKSFDCSPTNTNQDEGFLSPPVRGTYGSSLGSVGSATRWLLSTESLPVVLVVGLSGFGLLGALVSRFARKREGDGHQDTALDIISVAFSGFVAALVVFLAAYGGIAIVSMSDGDPNPYVVFAACLVGAIFAEDVWAKARTAFLTAASAKDDNDAPEAEVPAAPQP